MNSLFITHCEWDLVHNIHMLDARVTQCLNTMIGSISICRLLSLCQMYQILQWMWVCSEKIAWHGLLRELGLRLWPFPAYALWRLLKRLLKPSLCGHAISHTRRSHIPALSIDKLGMGPGDRAKRVQWIDYHTANHMTLITIATVYIGLHEFVNIESGKYWTKCLLLW